MNFLKHSLSMAVLAVISAQASAQIISATEPIVIPVDGYVVTAAQDTLKGKVAVRVVINYVNQVTLKDQNGNKTKYSADEIMAFGQKRPKLLRDYDDLTTIDKDKVHYESIEHPSKAGKKVFAERLMNGSRIKIFSNPNSMETSTAIGGIKLKDDESSYVVYKQGSQPFILKRKNYEEEFAALFGDCPEFMNYAKDKPDFKKFKQVGAVVDNYNSRCRD